MSRTIGSKTDLELIVEGLISGGYQYLIEGGLDITDRIRPRLVRLLADQGHRRGFRYGDDWGPFFVEFNLTQLANDIGDDIQGAGFQFALIEAETWSDELEWLAGWSSRDLYPLDSPEAIEAARARLRELGRYDVEIRYTCGTFEELCEGEADTVKTRLRLIADDTRGEGTE